MEIRASPHLSNDKKDRQERSSKRDSEREKERERK